MNAREEILIQLNIDYQKGLTAIGEYQSKIANLKAEQERLTKSFKDSEITQGEYKRGVNDCNIQIKEYQNSIRIVTKELQNNVKQERAAAGSIDDLKARLSNLTAAYNKLGDSEADRAKKAKLGSEISTITQKLNEEEQALGNFRRQVGNYEVATTSLRQELKKFREEMAQLKVDGKDGSEEYLKLAEQASKVSDAMGDVNREIGVGASDTKGLDTAMQSITTLTASLTAMNAVQSLTGKGSEEMQAIIRKGQVVVGALSAAIAIQNTLQKEGAVIGAIMTMQSKARAAAKALETKGTVGATIAQKVFNRVAMANPYVLLAIALATVVAALAIFAFGTESATEKQEKLNKATAAGLDALERSASLIREKHRASIEAAQDELSLAQAQGKSAEELEVLHQNLYRAKKAMTAELRKDASHEIMDINRNITEYERLGKQIDKVKAQIADGKGGEKVTVTIGGVPKVEDADDIIDTMQSAYDNLGRQIQVGVTAKAEDDEEAKKEALRTAAIDKQVKDAAIAAAKEARQKERELIRAAEDAVFALKKEGQEKETEEVKRKFARQIDDLQVKLKTESNLTRTARQKIKEQISSLTEQEKQELAAIDDQYSRAAFDRQLAEQEQFIANRLSRAKEGTQVEFNLKMQSLDNQMEAELEANRRRVETEQMDEALILDKYAAIREQAEKDRNKRIADETLAESRLKVENELLQVELDGGNVLEAKLKAKKAEIAAFTQLEDETNEERKNRGLKLAQELQDIEAEIQDKKRQGLEDTVSAFGAMSGSLSKLMENLGEDNEAMAGFSKALALVEIGISTGVAIAKGVKNAIDAGPFPLNLAAIASTIAIVIANIATATQLVNKQKAPKAPKLNKYATGGLVSGAGSGTSDSIPSMLSNGESVMTALTTSMFSPILSSLNQIGGGVPIQIQQVGSQAMGEDMLARAFAKGAAALPAPVVSVEALEQANRRNVQIETLRGL